MAAIPLQVNKANIALTASLFDVIGLLEHVITSMAFSDALVVIEKQQARIPGA